MNQNSNSNEELIFTGIPVSEGVSFAKILKFDAGPKPVQCFSIPEDQVNEEIARFENAIINTRREIIKIQSKIAKAMDKEHASIFNAHLLLIEDFTILEEVIQGIKSNLKNAEYIFSDVMKKFTKIFSEMEDEYLKERVADIKDVCRRVIKNLQGENHDEIPEFEDNVIILAYDLSPSETAMMHRGKVSGFATDIGGKTSHSAIMARSLGIPAVVGLHDVSNQIITGSQAILDGNKGVLIVHPSKETLKKYHDKKSELERFERELLNLNNLKAETKDGYIVQLTANIELPEDVPSVLSHGAEGIGLYRTEYCYMNRKDLPTEDELFRIYKNIVVNMEGLPVTIRTMDIGGDKFLCHMNLPDEMNPFLGWRAIRFCLEKKDIFKSQIRAILKSSAFGKVKILFPMISNLEEVIQAIEVTEECKKELISQGIPHDENLDIGVMIEIPSAAMISSSIARYVDFFSIGSNDLIQYTLAVDRVNEKIAYLYQPLHPAVIHLINNVVKSANENNIELSLCGEMASDPCSAYLLMGLGIKNMSMSAFFIPRIKNMIRSMDYSECLKVCQNLVHCSTEKEVKSLLEPHVNQLIPTIYD